MKVGFWFHLATIHTLIPVKPNPKVKVCLCSSIIQRYLIATETADLNAKGKPNNPRLNKMSYS